MTITIEPAVIPEREIALLKQRVTKLESDVYKLNTIITMFNNSISDVSYIPTHCNNCNMDIVSIEPGTCGFANCPCGLNVSD